MFDIIHTMNKTLVFKFSQSKATVSIHLATRFCVF